MMRMVRRRKGGGERGGRIEESLRSGYVDVLIYVLVGGEEGGFF